MAWREISGKPDLRRTDIRFTTTDASGRQVTETFYMDQNLLTGAYIIYKDNPIPLAGDLVLIRSDQESTSGLYKIDLGPGSEISPPGIDTKQYQRLIATKLAEDADSKRADLYRKIGATPIATTLGVPGFRNVATPNPVTPTGSNPNPAQTPDGAGPPAPTGGDPDPQAATVQPMNISTTISDGYVRRNYGEAKNLRYPESLKLETQDCIQFKMFRYGARSIDASSEAKALNLKLPNRTFEDIIGTVTLPIQPSITDSNGVDWGGANLSATDAYFASLARGAMEGEGSAAEVISGLLARVSGDLKKAATDPNIRNAVLTYFTQEAVGIQGLLSRTAGAILNPNLELLFNGPTLRPFNFAFKLSPRSKKEAENVRRIIRFFKQGMSVKTSPSSIFLKTPNVFEIKYLTDGGKDHPSLNKIKKCALLSCDVDYTPDGTYMTFNDDSRTMTSYQLTLRFSELDPIYEEDYNSDEYNLSEKDTKIGF